VPSTSLTPWDPYEAPTQLSPAQYSTPTPHMIDSPKTPVPSLQSAAPPSVVTIQADESASQHASQHQNTSTRAEINTARNVQVCFGMISGISGKCERTVSSERLSPFLVELNSSGALSAIGDPQMEVQLLPDDEQMIHGLFNESTLAVYVLCIPNDDLPRQNKGRNSAQFPCGLEITVYGPLDLFEEIGIWFEDYGQYLQDPRACHHDVRYWNPHRLSSDDFESCPLLSQIISYTFETPFFQGLTEESDPLNILSTHIDLEEATQPAAIKTALQSHQKKALTFLLRREKGWDFESDQPDIWKRLDTVKGQFFINQISASRQEEEPPQFYGGIMADPMGLGKTLTMIALAASDLDGGTHSHMCPMQLDSGGKYCIEATLIVIPPPLLSSWEEQLSEHVAVGGLKWRRHHEKTRITKRYELDDVNVVLTTYHTVSAEWKNEREDESSILFSVRWKRIILDEAHFIRNGKSRMAHAICALDSVARWAVTGTPIQNCLGDPASLLKFIRAHPYTDPKQFDADIVHLWKSGKDEEAAKRLQHLSTCILLRRPKAIINLPPRRDLRCPINFSHEEREMYAEIREQAITRIDEALQNNSETPRAGVHTNILQQVESLRLVCNLGLHYHARHQKSLSSSTEASYWARNAQQAFNVQRGMGPIVCVQCSSTLESTETLLDDSSTANQNPSFTRCSKFVCGGCTRKSTRKDGKFNCGHRPLCHTASVSVKMHDCEDIPGIVSPQREAASASLPSKVEALIADIKTLSPDTKCIVFSTWRLTLDIVEAGLDQASLRSIRFDGQVPQKERQSVVNQFKRDPSIRVMLLTLSCGAVGNPTLEEQALARIHRIGQKQSVTTMRFYVRESLEEVE
ncbi:hypothetical protein MKX08_003416, partial [Trichoderma sp. CBMAI-0020]